MVMGIYFSVLEDDMAVLCCKKMKK